MNPTIKFGYKIFVKMIDKGLLEFLGPLGLTNFFRSASVYASSLQSGLIYHYAFVFLAGLLLLLTLFALNFSLLYFFEPGLLFVIFLSAVAVIVFN